MKREREIGGREGNKCQSRNRLFVTTRTLRNLGYEHELHNRKKMRIVNLKRLSDIRSVILLFLL